MRNLLYSILIVFMLLPIGVVHAAAGELYIYPDRGVYRVGDTFDIKILANADGVEVNAIEGELAYNPNEVAIEKLSIEGSILSSWSTTPAFDGAAGLIKFSGWTAEKFAGPDGILITVTVRPLKVAQTTILFNSGAMLAADGHGSNVITSMRSASYTINAQQITPPAQPLRTMPNEETASQPEIQSSGQHSPANTQIVPEPQTSQAAALVLSGIEFAPSIVIFFAILTLLAFCIAYILHRKRAR